MSRFAALLPLLALALGAEALAQDAGSEPVVVRLASGDCSVAHSPIRLGDVATVAGASPERAARLEALELGALPRRPGMRRTLSAGTLRARLRAEPGLQLEGTRVTVQPDLVELPSAEILDLAQAAARRAGYRLSEIGVQPQSLWLPREQAQGREPGARVLALRGSYVQIEVGYLDLRRGTTRLSLRLGQAGASPRPTQAPTDARPDRRPTYGPQPAPARPAPAPGVSTRDPVSMIVHSGAFELAFPGGRALSSGRPGDVIEIVIRMTRGARPQRVPALVVGPGVVRYLPQAERAALAATSRANSRPSRPQRASQ